MRILITLAIVFAVSKAFGFAPITETDVQARLGAVKVIEISTEAVRANLVPRGSMCFEKLLSNSARAYVVKKGAETSLYVTEEGLDGLEQCLIL